MGDWLPQIPRAGLGWLELFSGRESWRERFVFTGEGLGIALFLYLVAVLLLTFTGGLMQGSLPGYVDTFYVILFNALPLALLWLVFLLTRAVLAPSVPSLVFLVPTVYAFVFKLLLDFLLVFAGPVFDYPTFGLLGYAMFRLGRLGLSLNLGLAIAFSALCLVALVLMRLALYMLPAPTPA